MESEIRGGNESPCETGNGDWGIFNGKESEEIKKKTSKCSVWADSREQRETLLLRASENSDFLRQLH
ncbi:hypothetical protein SLA2020_079010 [Shorea laevis]